MSYCLQAFNLLPAPMPKIDRELPETEPKPKGVENRNRDLEWILNRVRETGKPSGWIYFADDDNSYDVRIFDEVCSALEL